MHFKAAAAAAAFAVMTVLTTVTAHTRFTNLYVNGVNQGDGTCIRMNLDPSHTVDPIKSIVGPDMACGADGEKPVSLVCPASAGDMVTFQYKLWPDGSHPGVIDSMHKGPCSVYAKKMPSLTSRPDTTNATAAGPGWFKLYYSDYDTSTSQWCTEKLIAANGFLSVPIPADLEPGYYLFRPELLALHNAVNTPNDPQFFVGCAQVFVSSNGTATPSETVAIPSAEDYVNYDMPSMHFNIWETPLDLPFTEYGPPTYRGGGSSTNTSVSSSSSSSSSPSTASSSPSPSSSPESCNSPYSFSPSTPKTNTNTATTQAKDDLTPTPLLKQTEGLLPPNAIMVNANWVGTELSPYSTENDCWDQSAACWSQNQDCWDSAPPTGGSGCEAWEVKCQEIVDRCDAGDFEGPPDEGKVLTLTPEPAVLTMMMGDDDDGSSYGI